MSKPTKMATVIAMSPTGEIVFRDDFEIPHRSTLRQIREKGVEVGLALVEKILAVPENGLCHEAPARRWIFEILMGSKRTSATPSDYTF